MEKDTAMKLWTQLACVSALALAATACNRNPAATDGNAQAQMALPALPATLPLEAGAATEIAPAPSASDLPDAKPLRLARVTDNSQAYGYADAAYSYDEVLGDAPPDYAFDYEGADPWAWQGYDDSLMVAEPIDDGYRYYYYRPGADEPYFVRDPFYSYGYADGLLAVVYGADGGIVPYADYGPRLIYASRYYARGSQLYGASRRGQRRPVIAANWTRQRPVILAARERWGAGRAHQPAWQRYYDANRPRQTAYWSAEQVRRQADARRFDDWRQGGFRSAPPPRAIPVAWEKAQWAKDDRRYRPAAEARRNDRPQVDQREARQDRQDARQDAQQQAQRDQAQVQRQAERAQAQAQRQAQAGQPERDGRREQAQADRRGANQAQQREARQAERQQAQQQQQAQQRDARQARQREAQQAQRQQQQAQQRDARQAQQHEAQQARRQQQQAARQQQQREARQAQQQPDARQAERRQQQQAERAQQQQAAQAQRRDAQQAERREAQQAQRQQQQAEARQAQQAERQQAQQAQRQQAQQAARQQQQAERQQAQQAQRQQAQQAERQQQQAQQRQQQQAERQQQQQQRQQQRQDRRDARGPN